VGSLGARLEKNKVLLEGTFFGLLLGGGFPIWGVGGWEVWNHVEEGSGNSGRGNWRWGTSGPGWPKVGVNVVNPFLGQVPLLCLKGLPGTSRHLAFSGTP